MNLFRKGDIVRVGRDFIKDSPSLEGKFGRIVFVRGDICQTIFKDASIYLYDFHYTKLYNKKLLRIRKIENILND